MIRGAIAMGNINVLLDPGHGGKDTGAVGQNGTREKDINLKLAKMVGELLTDRGIDVAYTRTADILLGDDIQSDLKERVRLANEVHKPQYFVSIHNNSYTKDSKGTETYIVSTGGQAEKLAKSIHSNLISATGQYDRGVKTANFYVLKYTNMPAVLIEVAFLSNPNEEKLLNNDVFLTKAATGIAKGVAEFLGVAWEKPKDIKDIAWEWAIKEGLAKEADRYRAVTFDDVITALYRIANKTIAKPKHTKSIIDGVLVVEIEPMALRCKDMVLKSGKELAKEYKNFVNGNFFLWENGKIKKSIGWLVSEGKILASRYEHIEHGWAGNPKGTFIVSRDDTVSTGWRWDSDMQKIEHDIWFCVQGFNLFPPTLTLKEGLQKEGWNYDEVARKTNRIAIGYNQIKNKAVVVVKKDCDAQEMQSIVIDLGCKNNAICLDSGGSCNAVVDGEAFVTTDRQLANIIYW